MKRVVLVLAVSCIVFSLAAAGCQQPTTHDRYRQIMQRRAVDADRMGMKDDLDAVFLEEHPTHLSPWYHR